MNKYRSRRFMLAMLALLIGGAGMLMGRDVGGFGVLVGTILAGYGFTRSEFAGGRDETP